MNGRCGIEINATTALIREEVRATALALIDAQVFDAALLDVNLNGNDSLPVAEALSARGVPFVYSTGNTGHSLQAGYSDRPVLKKPFKYEELAAILTRLKLAPIER
jgi:CheY-like chemotaxis protein